MNSYYSNTLAPSSNQSWFKGDGTIQKGRIFYKIFAGGTYNYSFMFTNTVDSTYSDGSHSKCNLICDTWEILSLNVYVADGISNSLKESEKKCVLFNGNISKTVIPGEIFYSDTIELSFKKGEYLCLEIEFKGDGKIPYMEELIISSFIYRDENWVAERKIPLAASILCDRKIDKRIAFFGDSITEGIGVNHNSYNWWCSQIAELTGEKYGYWDIGIGFGRAHDAASKGAWLNKALMCDTVAVCFGVNDICQGFNEDIIKNNIDTIVTELKNAGKNVILFTIPPFDYNESREEIWRSVNNYIKNNLSKEVKVYDVVPIWGYEAPNDHKAKYGGHPNEQGSTLLAHDFVSKIDL